MFTILDKVMHPRKLNFLNALNEDNITDAQDFIDSAVNPDIEDWLQKGFDSFNQKIKKAGTLSAEQKKTFKFFISNRFSPPKLPYEVAEPLIKELISELNNNLDIYITGQADSKLIDQIQQSIDFINIFKIQIDSKVIDELDSKSQYFSKPVHNPSSALTKPLIKRGGVEIKIASV